MLGTINMERIKCKDYFIIKIRVYADEKILDEWHKGNTVGVPKQHTERSKAHSEFFWQLVEKVTNKERKYWFLEYGLDAREAMTEELADTYDIQILGRESERTFMIPKTSPEIFEWVKNNVTNPSKVLKKTLLGFWAYKKPQTNFREVGRQNNKGLREKYLAEISKQMNK